MDTTAQPHQMQWCSDQWGSDSQRWHKEQELQVGQKKVHRRTGRAGVCAKVDERWRTAMLFQNDEEDQPGSSLVCEARWLEAFNIQSSL